MAPTKKTTNVKKTDPELERFAGVLMAHIGAPPSNFEQIVKESIKDFRKEEKEAEL